ncbi:hypothetical protein ACOME3_009194 [Neoechinorhynchus agilis]
MKQRTMPPLSSMDQSIDNQTEGSEHVSNSDGEAELEEIVQKLRKELEDRDKQLLEMKSFQSNVGSEIEELTSNLFTEAYKMVDVAKSEAAVAIDKCRRLEKQLEEFKHSDNNTSTINQVELRSSSTRSFNHSTESLITSRDSIGTKSFTDGGKSIFSVFKKNFRKKSPPPNERTSSTTSSGNQQIILVDPYLYRQFEEWTKLGKFDRTHPFYQSVKDWDMIPSLNFPAFTMTDKIFELFMSDNVRIEKMNTINNRDASFDNLSNEAALHPFRRCALLPEVKTVEYRLKLPEPIPNERAVTLSLSINDLTIKKNFCINH